MALALLASPPPPLGVRRSFGTRCSLISDVKRDAIVNVIEAMAVIGRSSVTTGDSLSATWRLLWTTEKEQLFYHREGGLVRDARRRGTPQVIDVRKGTLNNVITFPPDGVFFVRSHIDISSPQRVYFRFENVYMDGDIRVAKDIRGDYLVVDPAPFIWKE